MAGLYIHIPYCKQACHYCDFHFSTNTSTQDEMVNAIFNELQLQRNFLRSEKLETIYFGGGTPSVLTQQQLEKIFEAIYKLFPIIEFPEISLEANPDDINKEKLKIFHQLGINRLSIGLQTFHEDFLKMMNRAHTASESYESVKMAQDTGFSNISIDLIYGIPANNHSIWEKDLQMALKLNTTHISSYCLTIEEKTAFGKWKKNGSFLEANDDFSALQFEILVDTLTHNQFIQYEISNFGKENCFSTHNSNYWKGIKYLGIGPGAHSFDGYHRQSNVSNNIKYINSLKENLIPFTKEVLSPKDNANDYLLSSLRTIWGTNLKTLKNIYSNDFQGFMNKVSAQINGGFLNQNEEILTLTPKGKLLADSISSKLFFE